SGPTTVEVGPGGSLSYSPDEVQVRPGSTVEWVWQSDGHNVVADTVPEGASWSGTQGGDGTLYDTGHTYSHTFETLGEYSYYCTPHESAGMVGTVIVTENPATGGGEKELHELGVPIQAHWVGLSTILAIIGVLNYTFYMLKYGESPNTGNTGGGED
ncbi:plastocyanin/azurin family copper-binding protein, partial [Halobium palmae]